MRAGFQRWAGHTHLGITATLAPCQLRHARGGGACCDVASCERDDGAVSNTTLTSSILTKAGDANTPPEEMPCFPQILSYMNVWQPSKHGILCNLATPRLIYTACTQQSNFNSAGTKTDPLFKLMHATKKINK